MHAFHVHHLQCSKESQASTLLPVILKMSTLKKGKMELSWEVACKLVMWGHCIKRKHWHVWGQEW